MLRVVVTGDGSTTVLDSATGEHYHSVFGAVTESRHIFLSKGFNEIAPGINPVNVLEIGFGTGLNALVTLVESEALKRKVNYEAVEPDPLEAEVTGQMNYPAILGGEEILELFNRMHAIPADARHAITPNFSLKKISSPLEEAVLLPDTYHLVYFDAFSPGVQPGLWQPHIFEQLYTSVKSGGLVVTYCSKGTVLRAMKSAGFQVEKLPGPPGKRHMLRGCKDGM